MYGYSVQTYKDFDIIIADDGSTNETKELIDKFKENYPVEITHAWHEDEGYRRQKILNEAIVMAKNEYILFTDGDCIPREARVPSCWYRLIFRKFELASNVNLACHGGGDQCRTTFFE